MRSQNNLAFAKAYAECVESILLAALALLVPLVKPYALMVGLEGVAQSSLNEKHCTYSSLLVQTGLWMHFRVNQLMSLAQDTKSIVRQHLSGTRVENTFENRPPYLALMNHLDPARSPMHLASQAMLRPVKPRGIQQGDIPSQATKCFFVFKVPQSFHSFYFKVQRAWKKEERLEKDLVRMWQDMYKEVPETFAIKALGENVEPGMPDAIYCAKTPKANKEHREHLRHSVTN